MVPCGHVAAQFVIACHPNAVGGGSHRRRFPFFVYYRGRTFKHELERRNRQKTRLELLREGTRGYIYNYMGMGNGSNDF